MKHNLTKTTLAWLCGALVLGTVFLGVHVGGIHSLIAPEYHSASANTIDSPIYSQILDSTDYDASEDIAIDSDGNVYVTGGTDSPNFPATTLISATENTRRSVFVAKFSPDGRRLIYSLVLGGSKGETANGIAVDSEGCAYITGFTASPDFPTTAGAFATAHRGGHYGYDLFVTKVSPGGDSLVYSTFLGGSRDDYGNAIAVDESGHAYVTGETKSTDFPTTTGAFDTSYNDAETVYEEMYRGDIFVTKLSPDGGSLVYSTFLGGRNRDVGRGIALDTEGGVYVTGGTSSADFPSTSGAFNMSYGGGSYCIFVTKLNPDGSALAYSTFLGAGPGVGRDIAVDDAGCAYVTGGTDSAIFPITPGAYDTSHNGGRDAFVVKLNPNGSSLIYSTFLGGNENEEAWRIDVDSNGHAYVMGPTKSDDFPSTATIGVDSTKYGTFITKLGVDGGSLAYSVILIDGDGGYYRNAGIVVDDKGCAYITGSTCSPDFPTTKGAYDTRFNGGSDAFVAKLGPNGDELIFSTFLGGGGSASRAVTAVLAICIIIGAAVYIVARKKKRGKKEAATAPEARGES